MDYSAYTGNRSTASEYMHTVSDGVRLRIIDFKPDSKKTNSPVIIFIAGWISLISGWREFLAALTPRYRVIYAETREKRSSEVPDIRAVSFDMRWMQNDIADIVAGLTGQKTAFILAGSSLGASAIMEYCRSDGRMPLCTVLVGPNGEFRFPRFLGSLIPFIPPALYFAVKPIVKYYLRNFRVNSAAEKEQIEKYELTLDYADPYKLKKNALGVKNWSMSQGNGKIPVPSLILGATTDSLHSTGHLKELLPFFDKPQYVELLSNRETHSVKAAQVMTRYIERIARSAAKV